MPAGLFNWQIMLYFTYMSAKSIKNLVIVESPAKAKKIGGYLGKDYTVMASVGHIRSSH